MASKKNVEKKKKQGGEPIFIVKPALKRGGLDYLHIALIALVLILVALAASLATFRSYEVCGYGINATGSCIVPVHNSSQAFSAAEAVLAGYSTLNSSLALLPYYTYVNESEVSYLPKTNEWLAVFPYLDPLTNSKSNFSILLYGNNLSLAQSSIQTIPPLNITGNRVTAFGAIAMKDKVLCASKPPIPIYSIIDPYAPGSISALQAAINASNKYGSRINMSYKFIFTGNAIEKYPKYGVRRTQQLGYYLFCASQQPTFPSFVKYLGDVFDGNPPSNSTMATLLSDANVNQTQFATCLGSAASALQYQAVLANYYNVTQTPQFIVDCKYLALPETLSPAINYTLSSINASTSK